MVEAAETGAIRIFVGGLGENVTAADIEGTFAPLGKVRGVELVRKDGRGFGYMDFEPQSDKSLARLFSTYNGCKWKGGKLRLEKAKEHYLSRLKREWEEDAAASIPVPVNQDLETKEEEIKHKNSNLDFMKISIFFPKLKKIKLLPYKGSGKHKYSFQRVEVPSTLPLHFCDCEEHCGPSESANQTYQSALDSAAHAKELSIMHSVMNKLLKESGELEELVAKPDHVELVENNEEEEGERIVAKSDFELVENNVEEEREYEREEEIMEEESDEDLVINISSRVSDESILDFKVSDLVPPKQELKERKHQQSTEKVLKRNVQKQTPKALEPTTDEEKPSVVTTERSSVDEFSSLLPRNDTSSVENHDQTNEQKSTEKSGKSSDRWFQKSAWRDLVGDSTKNLFSLSSSAQPSVSSIFSNQPVTEKSVADSTNNISKKRKVISNKEGSVSAPPEAVIGEEEENKRPKQEVRRVAQKVKVGEVCSFMKSAESEKEWNKTKKALSGYMKKKGGESSNVSGMRKGAPFPGKRFAK